MEFEVKSSVNDNHPSQDYILPFLIDNLSLHGKVVSLSESITTIINQHNYPEPVSKLLMELIVFTSLLGSNLKGDGIITVEIRSPNSLIKLMVVDYVFGGKVRGYSSFDEESIKTYANPSFQDLVGGGTLIITMDLGGGFERYQGIVEINGEGLIDSVKEYLKNSQQIDAGIKIICELKQLKKSKKCIAGGIMVQKLPKSSAMFLEEDDHWTRVQQFISSITKEEMLLQKISAKELLNRLFHEDIVFTYEEMPIIHQCRCSRKKMKDVIDSISLVEIERLKVDGKVEITCNFCSKTEKFD